MALGALGAIPTGGASVAAVPGVLAGKAALENAEDIGDAFSGRNTVTGEKFDAGDVGANLAGSGLAIGLSALPGAGKAVGNASKAVANASKNIIKKGAKDEASTLAKNIATKAGQNADDIEKSIAKGLKEQPAIEIEKNLDKTIDKNAENEI